MLHTEFYIKPDFVQQLTEQLSHQNLQVDKAPGDFSHDLIVKNPITQKRVFIEFKNSGLSGELPLTIANALYNEKMRLATNDLLFLVTFSSISDYLENKLNNLGIKSFARPTPDEVAQKVREAIAA